MAKQPRKPVKNAVQSQSAERRLAGTVAACVGKHAGRYAAPAAVNTADSDGDCNLPDTAECLLYRLEKRQPCGGTVVSDPATDRLSG